MSKLSFACGHTEEQEHALVNEFFDGLRAYMKQCGRFMGKPIAENWQTLDEQAKDHHINVLFVRHAVTLTKLAHDAIHEATKA
jgi:hypothetical protein